ncbi:MAG: GTPase ObgE [Planctomycetes bacterium]|nr:GTPase ObgE [Planctomycetota bacterium]
MPFLDEVELQLFAGKGGAGCISFAREKHMPRGGPDGGNGGRGGDVILIARTSRNTFDDLKGKRHWRAGNGGQGEANKRAGRAGGDLLLELPVGTVVRDAARGHVLVELVAADQPVPLLKGGRGGRGNHSFKGPNRQTPRIAEPGEEGELRKVRLELRLLADAGLVGLPNAGKSTLLSRLSAARPKVAHYPFTTLQPRIGVVERDFEQMTLADLPGLIEGASDGKGLGHQFLKHVERTRVLVHLVDASSGDAATIAAAWRIVRGELEAYGETIAAKPELLVLSKADLCTEPPPVAEVARLTGRDPLVLSSHAGIGLEELGARLFALRRPAAAPDAG